MQINTVEMQEDGSFLVNKNVDANDNGQFIVPDDMANKHRRKVQAWIDAGNTPTPFDPYHGATLANAKTKKKDEIDFLVRKNFERHVDHYYIKHYRKGQRGQGQPSIPATAQTYEDTLTANQDTANTAIDALTTNQDVYNYQMVWPDPPSV